MAQPFAAPTSETKTYVGCCHCQATKFTVKLDKLLEYVWCNCSFCAMQGITWAFFDEKDIHYEREGPKSTYQFGAKTLDIFFCSNCGNTFGARMSKPNEIGINLRLLQDVDIWSLKVHSVYDGRAMGSKYEPPAFKGKPFSEISSEKKLYNGNCHCGAISFISRLPDLDGEKPNVNECNCSFCSKSGRIHAYPASGEDVHVHGVEHLVKYTQPERPRQKAWLCQHCGTHLFTGTDAEPGNLNQNELGHDINIRAVTLRVLQDVDLEKVNINRYNGRDRLPLYEVK